MSGFTTLIEYNYCYPVKHIIPCPFYYVKRFFKIFTFILKNDVYHFIHSDNIEESFKLNILETVCDLAYIHQKNLTRPQDLYFEPINSDSKEIAFKKLSLICRKATAFILCEFFDEKENEDIILDIITACYEAAEAILPFYQHSYKTGELDFTHSLLPDVFELSESELKFTNIDGIAYETRTFTKIKHFLYYDFFKGIEKFNSSNRILIKQCENPQCGRYFVVKGRSSKLYCDYPSPQKPHLSCDDNELIRYYGLTDIEANTKKLENSLATALRQRYKRKNDTESFYALEHFRKRNKEMKEGIKLGDITMSNYYDWLKNYRKVD